MTKSIAAMERFWQKVDKTETCWLWTHGRSRKGYGQFWADGKQLQAHRWAYEQMVGPIPEGMTLDHLVDRCRNKHCVRPDHLEPVTPEENHRRWVEAQRSVPTCKRGHEWTPENSYVNQAGLRRCKACRASNEKARGAHRVRDRRRRATPN